MASADQTYLSEINNHSELNQQDTENESLLTTLTHGFTAIRDTIVCAIRDSLRAVLGGFDGVLPLVTYLVNGLLSLVGSLSALTVGKLPTWSRVLLYGTTLTSLTSLIVGVADLSKRLGFSWLADDATKAAQQFMTDVILDESDDEEQTATSNASDPAKWVKLGVCSLVAVLFAGLGLTKTVNWKDLIVTGNVVDSVRKVSTNVTSVADYLIDEIMGYEADADYLVCKELEELADEGAALQRLSAAHYIQHCEDLVRLDRFLPRIVKATTSKLSSKTSHRYQTVRHILVTIYKNLEEKRRVIDAIVATQGRQVTIGIVLSGPAGHGKSEFGKYLMRNVCTELGYDPRIFTLNKRTDGFYELYSGQGAGCCNEFMSRRSEDPFLPDLNLLISGDPMNLEGAHLDAKMQQCKIKIVFLTTNEDNPDFTRVLSAGAAQAVWDRLYHVKVYDPKCKGRQAPNPHRMPDFSHLTFTLVQHYGKNIRVKPIDYDIIFERMVCRCAEAEMKYIKDILPAADAETAGQLGARILVLEEKMKNRSGYDEPIPPQDIHFFPESEATSNGWGRDFFVTRFQGTIGSGKTTAAERYAREMSYLFNYKIQLSRTADEFIPDESMPMVYVLDDHAESYDGAIFQEFLEKMNRTHPRSIFVVCSNTVYERKRVYRISSVFDGIANYFLGNKNVKPWDCSEFDGPTGVLRRIGLQGFIRLPSGEIVQNSETLNRTYTFDSNFVLRDAYGTIGNIDQVIDIGFDMYRVYLDQPSDFCLVEGEPPFVDKDKVGVKITAKTIPELVRCMKSHWQQMQAFNGKHKSVSIFISPKISGMTSPSQTMISQWGIPEPDDDNLDNVRSIYSRMCATFQRSFPGKSLTVVIKDRDLNFYFINNLAYMYSSKKLAEEYPIYADGQHIGMKINSVESVVVTIEQYICMRKFNQYSGDLLRLNRANLRVLNRWIDNMVHSETADPVFRVAYLKEWQRQSRVFNTRLISIEAAIRKHPIFWLGCSLLFLLGVGKLACMLFSYFNGKSAPEPQTSNSATPAEDKGYGGPQRVINRINVRANDDSIEHKTNKGRYHSGRVTGTVSAGRTKPRFISTANSTVERIYERLKPTLGDLSDDQEQRILEELYRYSTNGGLCDEETLVSIFLADIDQGNKPYLALCNAMRVADAPPKRSPTASLVHSNMLSVQNMIPNRQTVLQALHKKLNKFYYRLTDSLGRSCYALGLRDTYLLTVSHMFEKVGETCSVSSGPQSWSARCVYLNRPRDLAVLSVENKAFPRCADTYSYFHDEEDLCESLYGFFMRCGPEFEIAGGGAGYHPKTLYPIWDKDNPNFLLSEKAIAFVAAGLRDISAFVQPGDCGFPLVTACKQSEYKIAGIHCAYNKHEKVFFSCFTKQDHIRFIAEATKYISNNSSLGELREVEVLGQYKFLAPKLYTEAFQNLEPTTKWDAYRDRLHILGYSKELHFSSNPKGAHKITSCPGLETPCLTLPAAYRLDHVQDFTELAVDSEGRADPLFTQMTKYDYRKKPSFDPVVLLEAAEITAQDFEYRYGSCKFLRLFNVINGIPGRALAPIDPATSAGPLLKKLFNINTKAPLFKLGESDGSGRTLVFNDTEAANLVRRLYEAFRDSLLSGGPPPLLISKDNSKVELIEMEKALKGKVRLFNEVDIPTNLLLRMLFGDLISKMQENHEECPIQLGQDPYKSASHIARAFAEIDGQIVSTDYKAFDKQLAAVLIRFFCYTAARCYRNDKLYDWMDLKAMFQRVANMLIYAVHLLKGNVILVDRGNESGTAVTTPLNSYSNMLVFRYSCIMVWKDLWKFTPTLSELLREIREFYLGDDGTKETSKALVMDFDLMAEYASHFCLTLTPAKADGDIVFCGRTIHWDEVNQIAWPALRLSSVFSQIHWYSSFSRDQIIQNLDNCLFEAALHPNSGIFDMVHRDAIRILKFYSLDATVLAFHGRSEIRQRFISYVRGGMELDVLSQHTSDSYRLDTPSDIVQRTYRVLTERLDRVLDPESPDVIQKRVHKFRQLIAKKDTLMSDPSVNPISALLERLQAAKLADRPQDDYSPTETGYLCRSKLLGADVVGVGRTKSMAKREAYAELYRTFDASLTERVQANSEIIGHAKAVRERLSKAFMYESVKVHLALAGHVSTSLSLPVCVLCRTVPEISEETLEGVRFGYDGSGAPHAHSATAQRMHYDSMAAVYLAQPGTSKGSGGSQIIFAPERPVLSNLGPPTGMSGGGGAMPAPGISTNPQVSNLVPSKLAPAFPNNQPTVLASIEAHDPQSLNSSGTPNMLRMGGVEFNIDDLIYSQMLDSGKIISWTDDAVEGTIIAQIPYNISSDYLNKYIKAYASLHTRYAGPLLFRFNLVSNPTFSGEVIIAWVPERIKGNTADLQDLQKYSYKVVGIDQVWNETFTLNDARQTQFYRNVSDVSDVDSRPHLVMAVYMAIQSPLREGVTARLRVSSQLDHTFEFANPIVGTAGSSGINASAEGLVQNSPERLIGSAVLPTLVRPIQAALNTDFRMVIDGNTWIRESGIPINSDYLYSAWSVDNNWLGRGIGIEDNQLDAYMNKGWIVNDTGLGAVYFDFRRSILMMNECKSAVDASSKFQNAGGYALPLSMRHDFVEKWKSVPADPIQELKNCLSGTGYKNYGGSAQYLYHVELQTDLKGTIYIAADDKVTTGSYAAKRVYIVMSTKGPFIYIYASVNGAPSPGDIRLYSNESAIFNSITQVKAIGFANNVEAMPAGWRHVVLTCERPYVYPQGSKTSSQINHVSVISLMDYFNFEIKSNECLQLTFSDVESGRPVATLRYFPDRKNFAINAPNSSLWYGVSQRPLDRMYITSSSVVERGSAFPITDIDLNFVDNQVHPDTYTSRNSDF